MSDTSETLSRQIWIAVFAAEFSRLTGNGWPAEKAAEASRDAAKNAVEGANEFLGSM